MRADPAACRVERPENLEAALECLAREPGALRPLAGGTDLMVAFAAGRCPWEAFLDLSLVEELEGIAWEPGHLVLGARVTYTRLREDALVRRLFPNLERSARVTGAVAIQNRGTLGGNVVNASPAADTPPSLLAYGAEVELASAAGSRWVDLGAFATGYKQTILAPEELLTRIRLPLPAEGTFHFFRKVGTRAAQAISKVCLAATASLEGGRITAIRVALGAVAPVPVRARRAEAALLGRPLADLPLEEARRALQEDISPIDDLRSTAHYRRTVAGNLLAQMLEALDAMNGSSMDPS
jgi:CO/xanthine dehydrogenase FAD-binding subunit